MTEEMPRNLIQAANQPEQVDQDELERRWLAENVPANRLELHWRYENGSVQLSERRLRSLAAYGVGPALCSYLRTRLEWFCDNKLYAQPSGIVVVIVETNGDVDMKLDTRVPAPSLTEEDLLWESGKLVGASIPGTLLARMGNELVIVNKNGLRDACESFAVDLAETLAKSMGYGVADRPVAKEDLSSCELFFVNDEVGELVVSGHEGPLTAKLSQCFDKLWSK